MYANYILKLFESLEDYPRKEDYRDKMQYLKDCWNYYNKKYFGSQLKEPEFVIKESRFRNDGSFIGGSYSSGYDIRTGENKSRKLTVSSQLLDHESMFHPILKHEMCHQAVSEIDDYHRGNQGKSYRSHGKNFKAWAKKCEIDPALRIGLSPSAEETVKASREAAESRRRVKKPEFSLFG